MDEAAFLRSQIVEIRRRKDALYAERVEYANTEVQTRLLLELRSPPGEGILDFAVTGEADGLNYASGRIRW